MFGLPNSVKSATDTSRGETRSREPSGTAAGRWPVDFVRVVVGGSCLRYQAVGCTHSRLVARPLSADAATDLIGKVPFVVRRASQVA
jgi:hypothetical protein